MINDSQDITDRCDDILLNIEELDEKYSSDDVANIREDIFSLLIEVINFYASKRTLTLWEKDSLERAIFFVQWNLIKNKDMVIWLYACLAAIKRSAIDESKRASQFMYDKDRETVLSQLEQKDFLSAIDSLRRGR